MRPGKQMNVATKIRHKLISRPSVAAKLTFAILMNRLHAPTEASESSVIAANSASVAAGSIRLLTSSDPAVFLISELAVVRAIPESKPYSSESSIAGSRYYLPNSLCFKHSWQQTHNSMMNIAIPNIARVPRYSLPGFSSAGKDQSVTALITLELRPATPMPSIREAMYLGGKTATMRYKVKKQVPLKMPKTKTREKQVQ